MSSSIFSLQPSEPENITNRLSEWAARNKYKTKFLGGVTNIYDRSMAGNASIVLRAGSAQFNIMTIEKDGLLIVQAWITFPPSNKMIDPLKKGLLFLGPKKIMRKHLENLTLSIGGVKLDTLKIEHSQS